MNTLALGLGAAYIVGAAIYVLKDWRKKPLTKEEALNEFIEKTNLKVTRTAKDKDGNPYTFDKYAYCRYCIESDEYESYHVVLPLGLGFSHLSKLTDLFENYFKRSVRIENQNHEYVIVVDKREGVCLRKRYDFDVVKVEDKSKLQITIGESEHGSLSFNLTDSNPHVLLAGTSSSGKSRLQKAILLQLIENYSPKELELVYLDNIGTECGAFKYVSHLKHRTTDIKATVKYLDDLEREIYHRNKLIESKDVTNIVNYNKAVKGDLKLPFIFVVVDELFPFLTLSSKEKTEAYNKLALLLSMSRSAGIHFMISTQKATTDVLPSLITANCGIVIGLRCRNSQESRNIIQEEGLEEIPLELKGRGIVLSDVKESVQAYWVEDSTINNICRKHKKK